MSAPLPFRFLGVSPLIPARDVEEAIAFYRDSLGFELRYRDAEPAQFAIVGRDAAQLHLFANQDKHLADWTSLRIEVDGIDALYGRCQEGGCVHPNGLLGERAWGAREFSIVDPSGVCAWPLCREWRELPGRAIGCAGNKKPASRMSFAGSVGLR